MFHPPSDARLPRTMFTDRGTGMYSGMGSVVHAYEEAVDAEGFKLFWGPDASRQSPDMGDMLLHETAVSWFRAGMKKEAPVVQPWKESREEWAARARRVVRRMNSEHNVRGLCLEFPSRLQAVQDRLGDRLPK